MCVGRQGARFITGCLFQMSATQSHTTLTQQSHTTKSHNRNRVTQSRHTCDGVLVLKAVVVQSGHDGEEGVRKHVLVPVVWWVEWSWFGGACLFVVCVVCVCVLVWRAVLGVRGAAIKGVLRVHAEGAVTAAESAASPLSHTRDTKVCQLACMPHSTSLSLTHPWRLQGQTWAPGPDPQPHSPDFE